MKGPFQTENSIVRVNDELNIAYVPMYTYVTVLAIQSSTYLLPTSFSGLSRQVVAYSSGLFRADTSVQAPQPCTSPTNLVPPARSGQAGSG